MLSTIESFKNKVRTRYDFAVAKLVIYVCALAHGLSLPA